MIECGSGRPPYCALEIVRDQASTNAPRICHRYLVTFRSCARIAGRCCFSRFRDPADLKVDQREEFGPHPVARR